MPVGDRPHDLVSEAAAAAFEAIDEHLAHADARCVKALLLLEIEGQPTNEATDVAAGHCIGDPKEVVTMLAGHLVAAASQLGVKIDLMPVHRRLEG